MLADVEFSTYIQMKHCRSAVACCGRYRDGAGNRCATYYLTPPSYYARPGDYAPRILWAMSAQIVSHESRSMPN